MDGSCDSEGLLALAVRVGALGPEVFDDSGREPAALEARLIASGALDPGLADALREVLADERRTCPRCGWPRAAAARSRDRVLCACPERRAAGATRRATPAGLAGCR